MRSIFIIGLLTSAIAAAAFAVEFEGRSNPHEFTRTDCFYCHLSPPSKGTPGEPLKFTDTVSNMCGRCHDMSKSISHQVDMKPSDRVNIPKDMPLDAAGKMTCVTCHDIHRAYINPLTGQKTYFLRRDVIGKNFCLSCHNTEEGIKQIRLAKAGPDAGRATLETSHRLVMDRGHGFSDLNVSGRSKNLDPLSLACLSCHESASAKTALKSGVWCHTASGIGLSHPVGVDYSLATMGKAGYVPEEKLDKRLRLFGGKIGCCTCHDPYEANGKTLVIGVRGNYQNLCLACHRELRRKFYAQ
jgi:predicted CXXCH cytochrome family protein